VVDVNRYFEINFELILDWSNNIYGKTSIDPQEVVSELYLDMLKPQRQETMPTDEKQMKWWILRWLRSRLSWTGGGTMHDFKVIGHEFFTNMIHDTYEFDTDKCEIKTDLKNAGFQDQEITKIKTCIQVSKQMPLYYKRIFSLYFIDGLTMEQIGNSCGLPKSAIYKQVKRVENYLKTKLDLNEQQILFQL